ncbi:hypothetical protein BSU04_27470 [Caballeronia sordidicola]|uniref:Uncharacterized protein n=1 Tax=Caballeronia sordidicola TaxID=196367 RepID=A0A226WXK2_CABSO|nr:hypothetical protein BSU04_27470 [Caballeronia sordidicola]
MGLADDALQRVLIGVVPDFKALVTRYPTVFCADHSHGLGFAQRLRDRWNRRGMA